MRSMTFTLTEGLLFIIAGTLMVMAGLLIWVAVRVSRVSGSFARFGALVSGAKRGLRVLLGRGASRHDNA